MCGRITLTSSASEVAAQFEVPDVPSLPARYNIAPSQEIVTVRMAREGLREVSLERWGLVPHWAKDPAIGNRMVNARCETLESKAAFRDAVRRRRCIVPASGFYEWSGSGASRRPYVFRMQSGALLGIAGLYERWIGPGGEVVDSCTIVTTDANETLRPFHDRMPVLLAPADHAQWLDRDERDPQRVLALCAPCPPDWLAHSPVSSRVNNPRNDDPACLEPEPVTGNLFS